MVVNKIISKLQKLGFGKYEARIYIALSEEHPTTAYEVAKRSGVPSSKVYEVISRLVARGAVVEFVESTKKLYSPVEAELFLSKFKSDTVELIDGLGEDFKNIDAGPGISYIENFSRYDTLMQKAMQLIKKARHTLLISAWGEELCGIIPLLKKSKARKVIVQFGGEPVTVGTVYPHPVEHQLLTEKGGRQFVLVSDTSEAISSTVFADGRVEGAWSKNSGFVVIAEDFVKHDVYILKVVNRFTDELSKTYGKGFPLLRDIYNNEVIE